MRVGPATHGRRRVLGALMLAAIALSASGCASDSTDISLSGRIADETVSIDVPNLTAPRSKPATVAGLVRLDQVSRVVSVAVAPGDHVDPGDEVARIDDARLAAEVRSARAAQRLADARVDVLSARIDDVIDARATISDSRATVRTAIADLTASRADLDAKLASARAQLAELRALLERLGHLPPGSTPPTGTPAPQQIVGMIAQLEAAVTQMESGIAKLDAGLAKARSARGNLEKADATTAEARRTLTGLRDVAREGAVMSGIAVEIARTRRELATLHSPVSGTVLETAQPGEALAPDSPVVRIRPTAASSVIAYVTPKQRARLTPGTRATVRIDSLPAETFAATLTLVGARATYPPSWFTTTETHMTRSFAVRVTLEDRTVQLPAGTPADIKIEF